MARCWRRYGFPLTIASSVLVGGAIASSGNCVLAQITPDGTLPNSSIVTSQGNTRVISGGTQAGSNLFHSFQEFSVPTGSAAYFNNALDVQNIFSRVTGESVSNIDGLIRANGTANLFLLNPNGIIFRPNARLDIGGSFIGSTASSLNFADGTQFSATAPQTAPLLTVSVPLGLQYGGTAGPILVQGLGNNLSVDPITLAFVRDENPLGLAVPPGKTLALVGGNVTLEGGNLIAEGGRIEVGSIVGPGLVSLTPTNKGWTLGYKNVPNVQDIQLSQRASVDASGSGGGDIQVQGRRVTLTDGSTIFAITSRSEPGGTVVINASDYVEVIGTSADDQFPSTVSTNTKGAGAAGDLRITTRQLSVRNGAQVTVNTLGIGDAGQLVVNASGSVQLIGTSADGQFPSGLFVDTVGVGAAGDLTITTRQLQVLDGAVVSASTSGRGKAGNLTVKALESVELSGTSKYEQRLSLTAQTTSIGDAGDLSTVTEYLNIRDRAEASVSSEGSGNAGNLKVAARSIHLDNQGKLSAHSLSGKGGNITLHLQDLLLMRRNSQISADAGTPDTSGTGGNIYIDADLIVAVPNENSDIIANSFFAVGGTIDITAQGIFGLVPRNLEEIKTLLATGDPIMLNPIYLPSSQPVERHSLLGRVSPPRSELCCAHALPKKSYYRGGARPSTLDPIGDYFVSHV